MFSVCLVVCAAGLLVAHTCLQGQYQILLVCPVGRKHLMSVLKAEIQRTPLEGECCISLLSGRGKNPFVQECQRFSLHSKQKDLVKFSGNVTLGFMWKMLVYITDEHIRLLHFNNEGACTQSHIPERNQMLIKKDSFSMPELPRTQRCGMGKRVFKWFREIKQLGKIKKSQLENHQNNDYLVCKMWDTMKKKADIYLHKYTSTAIHCQAVFPRDLWKGSLLHQEPVVIVDKKYLLKRLFGSDLDSVLWSRAVGGLTVSSKCLKGNDCVLKKKK